MYYAISTHAPRTGSDSYHKVIILFARFQPTLPARGATSKVRYPWTELSISTHAPRTGSDNLSSLFTRHIKISTHAPRTGSDPCYNVKCKSSKRFQPTLPARGATQILEGFQLMTLISTHAPRTGSDDFVDSLLMQCGDFNPRSPHGERRRCPMIQTAVVCHFNPRSPHGERPVSQQIISLLHGISTHAPRTGSDLFRLIAIFGHCRISTHAPRTGSDRRDACERDPLPISTHAPRTGSDTP